MASPVLLSPQEIVELKLMCANRFLELGSALRPKHLKCDEPHIVTSSSAVAISFPSHIAADKWNEMHQRRIRKGGHGATVALTTLVALFGGGAARTIASGSTAAIFKDEAQARIWYPKVFKEWTLTRHFRFTYQQLPHKFFQMEWTDVIHDEYGDEHERRMQGIFRLEVGEPFGLPEDLVHEIITRLPLHASRAFH